MGYPQLTEGDVGRQLEIDRTAMHEALCQAAGLTPGRGSQTAIANELGTSVQWYSRVMKGAGTADELIGWCNTLGVRVVCVDHQATFHVELVTTHSPSGVSVSWDEGDG